MDRELLEPVQKADMNIQEDSSFSTMPSEVQGKQEGQNSKGPQGEHPQRQERKTRKTARLSMGRGRKALQQIDSNCLSQVGTAKRKLAVEDEAMTDSGASEHILKKIKGGDQVMETEVLKEGVGASLHWTPSDP